MLNPQNKPIPVLSRELLDPNNSNLVLHRVSGPDDLGYITITSNESQIRVPYPLCRWLSDTILDVKIHIDFHNGREG